MNKEINIAESTGKAEYKVSPTKNAPCMEQLYFEFEDRNHIFQIGIKTLLECIIFGINENQLPKLP